jgi:hypothetical protein
MTCKNLYATNTSGKTQLLYNPITERRCVVAEKKPKHKIENLVVLQYASNICYTNVVKLDIEKLPTGVLSVDPSKGTWRA